MQFRLRWRDKGSSDAEGIAAVEFALLLTVFLMLILGILEFGYDWYLKGILNNASREGCRYGVRYSAPAGVRLAPSGLNPTIQNHVRSILSGQLPSAIYDTVVVTPSGAGYNTPYDGANNPNPLTVTVTATKNWNALSRFIALTDHLSITEATTMNVE